MDLPRIDKTEAHEPLQARSPIFTWLPEHERMQEAYGAQFAVPRSIARAALSAWPVAGQSDLARALGLSRQRIGQYRKLSDFPSPVQTVNGAPVWILGDVLEWHEARVTKREAKR